MSATASTTSTIIDSAAILLSLSKTVWKLGLSLSKLSQHVAFVDTIVSDLAAEVKALSLACDFIYTRLKELVDRNIPKPIDGNDVDNEIWDCLTSQIEVIGNTTVELEHFLKSDGRIDSQSAHRLQHLNRPSPQRDFVVNLRIKISRHTDDLTMTLLLINFSFISTARHREPRQTADELERLQSMITKLETALMGSPQTRISRIEAKLIGCARATIAQVSFTHVDVAPAEESKVTQNERNNSPQTASWLKALEALQFDPQNQERPTTAVRTSPRVSLLGKHTMMSSPRASTFVKPDVLIAEDSPCDDDFDADLARAAIDTGTEAFKAQEWEEADSLLQEALRALLQLNQGQRTFSDIFGLHYKLAVCGYYIREPSEGEHGLLSLGRLAPSTDEQRQCVYHTMHLLAQLYIQTNQIDLARSQCEKALQGRRRVLGKQSPDALESIALMAHIYVLLDNRARAKSCLAMIPEAQRDAVLGKVEASLGGLVEHLDFASLLTQATIDDSSSVASRGRRRLSSVSDESNITTRAAPGRFLASPLGMYRQDTTREPIHATEISPAPSQGQFKTVSSSPETPQSNLVHQAMLEDDPPVWTTPMLSPSGESKMLTTEPSSIPAEMDATAPKQGLSRPEILQRIGCRPRDKIEEAVCEGDLNALTAHLKKRKTFWRSSMRKRGGRSERVTALHFAALFGEVQMAQLLISSKFDVNQVPFGYSTSLTPLHFAIGARQVSTVALLLSHGAHPCPGESWTTLSKHLLSRPWMLKTTTPEDLNSDQTATDITAILALLLQHGWDVNAPSGPNQDTILHHAVALWTGSFKADMRLRVAVSAWLCEHGAGAGVRNARGVTPLDVAVREGHQEIVDLLAGDEGVGARRKEGRDGDGDGAGAQAVVQVLSELPGEMLGGEGKGV